MNKNLTLVCILLLVLNNAFSQVSTNESDSLYGSIKEFSNSKFPNLNIPNFRFSSYIIDLDLEFKPEKGFRINSRYLNYRFHGKVKKISTFYVYTDQDSLKYEVINSIATLNKKGQIVMSEESDEIKLNYYYDDANRLVQYERIVRNDTFFSKKIKYNKYNQIIEISSRSNRSGKVYTHKDIIEYDAQNRPCTIYYLGSDFRKDKRRAITYNDNIVKYQEYYNGKEINIKEFTYSINGHLIKSYNNSSKYSIYYSYNENGELVKEITFIGEKLYNIRTYSYDNYGNQLISTFSFGNSSEDEITTHIFQYDKFGNLIYDTYSTNASSRVNEIKYVLEYY